MGRANRARRGRYIIAVVEMPAVADNTPAPSHCTRVLATAVAVVQSVPHMCQIGATTAGRATSATHSFPYLVDGAIDVATAPSSPHHPAKPINTRLGAVLNWAVPAAYFTINNLKGNYGSL